MIASRLTKLKIFINLTVASERRKYRVFISAVIKWTNFILCKEILSLFEKLLIFHMENFYCIKRKQPVESLHAEVMGYNNSVYQVNVKQFSLYPQIVM